MSDIIHTDQSPTLDDVWRLFREMVLESDREFRKLHLAIELSRQESERRFQDTEHEFREFRQLLKEQNMTAEKRSLEIDRRFQETDKKIGELGNRLGEFVEGFVAPAAIRLFKERNIEVNGLSRNIERKNKALDLATQIDLLAVNSDFCVVIEVKSLLSVDDVNDHLERLEKFKLLFPEYAHHKVYGAVAAMVIPTDVGRYAYRKGLFVIGQTGTAVKILNDEKFKPVEW